MGELQATPKVTPLVALLYRRDELCHRALKELSSLFGPMELQSPAFPFDKTKYYDEEMGTGLRRSFAVFAKLADPSALPDWKIFANNLEQTLAERLNPEKYRRPINIDPGYITGSKVILASTKDFAHRIYLRAGIFAEITLYYTKGRWEHHRCTFPDFKAETYHAFLSQARELHLHKGPERAR